MKNVLACCNGRRDLGTLTTITSVVLYHKIRTDPECPHLAWSLSSHASIRSKLRRNTPDRSNILLLDANLFVFDVRQLPVSLCIF